MNKKQLETFSCLAKTLNYAATSQLMYLSQPAVTQQIKALEEELGVKLFIRNTRKVELTAAGRVFYDDCQHILSRLDNAIVKARNYDRQFSNTLHIDCGNNMVITRLDQVLVKYRQSMPDIQLHITNSDPLRSLHSFLREEVDVIFGVYDKTSLSDSIHFDPLFQGQFVCVLPERSKNCEKPYLTIEDLKGEDLIFLERNCCPSEMQRIQDIIMNQIPDSILYFSSSSSISATMIQAGIGSAVMPNFACPEKPGLVVKPLMGFEDIPYGIFRRKKDNSHKTLRFIQVAQEVYRDYSS